MEALYQEGGRAGRDGEDAQCYVLFTKADREIPDWLHAVETEPDEIRNWNNENGKVSGDLGTQLYLTFIDLNKIEDDLIVCMKILETVEKSAPKDCTIMRSSYNFDELFFDENKKKREVKVNIQKAIYRLYILGVVEDWTVLGYGDQESYKVKTRKIDEIEMANSLTRYISRYEKNKANKKINKRSISEILNTYKREETKIELVRFLLKWNYNNFVYYRRQSMKNLYEACLGYSEPKRDEFKEKLDNYFRLDDLTRDIASLMEASPRQAVKLVRMWLAPNKRLVNNREIQKIKDSLSRYLESERNNPSLDLLSGVIRLVTDDFHNADGKPRLESFIKISQEEEENWSKTFRKLCKFISNLDQSYKEQFSDAVGGLLENNSDLIMLHEILQDDSSAVIYLDRFNKKLEKIMG